MGFSCHFCISDGQVGFYFYVLFAPRWKKKRQIFLKPFFLYSKPPQTLTSPHTPNTDKTCEPPDCLFFFWREITLEVSWCKLLAITTAAGPQAEGDTRVDYSDEGQLQFSQLLSKGLQHIYFSSKEFYFVVCIIFSIYFLGIFSFLLNKYMVFIWRV